MPAAGNMAHLETRFKIENSRALTQYRLKKPALENLLEIRVLRSRLEFEFTHVLWSYDHSGPEDNFAFVADGVFAEPAPPRRFHLSLPLPCPEHKLAPPNKSDSQDLVHSTTYPGQRHRGSIS